MLAGGNSRTCIPDACQLRRKERIRNEDQTIDVERLLSAGEMMPDTRLLRLALNIPAGRAQVRSRCTRWIKPAQTRSLL